MTAMGQGKTQVSPYQMALITSAIANGGTLMRPYLGNSHGGADRFFNGLLITYCGYHIHAF